MTGRTKWDKQDRNRHPEQREDLLKAHRVPWGKLAGVHVTELDRGYVQWLTKHQFENTCPLGLLAPIIKEHYPELLNG